MAGEREGLAPRRAALAVLADVRQGRPFEQALDRALEPLPEADRRLAHELAAGVLRRQQTLDDRLAPLVPRGWDRVPRPLQDLLRLGAFQLTALQRVPAHAAVDTSVVVGEGIGWCPGGRLRQRRSAPPRSGRRSPVRASRLRAPSDWHGPTRILSGWWSGGWPGSAPKRPSACWSGTTSGRAWCCNRLGRTWRRSRTAGGRPGSRSSPRRSARGW